jgi:hypothetical protein
LVFIQCFYGFLYFFFCFFKFSIFVVLVLLVSPFNMKWRCSVPTGGVEGSKFCLFSMVLPARSVFSVSPRFHYRRHAFCFLPLAAILESS